MIRIKEIQNSLLHLVGWQQNYEVPGLIINEQLTKSESGMYFQQVHPLLTYTNLLSIAPDFDKCGYAKTHDVSKSYKENSIVLIEDKYYKAKHDVPKEVLITDSEYWEEIDLFSEWLENKTKASIIKVITNFVNLKLAEKASKTLIENKTLFDGTGRIVDTIKNRKNFVGFEIDAIRSKGVTVKIEKIGLQFTKPGKYKIFIMHSSNDSPIYTQEFIKTKSNSIEWFTPSEDILLPYESLANDAGGSWYIGYYQTDLPEGSEAIFKSRDWSTEPCKACSRQEFLAWQAWSKYIEVHPFYIQDDATLNNEQQTCMWDANNMVYTYDKNYGINLEISVYCDMTDFIIKQRGIFQDVITKQVAIDFLREFAYNPNVRTNRHAINASKIDILYELDGDSSSMKKSGLCYEQDLAMRALNISTQGLDRVCLPCINNGIKFRSI